MNYSPSHLPVPLLPSILSALATSPLKQNLKVKTKNKQRIKNKTAAKTNEKILARDSSESHSLYIFTLSVICNDSLLWLLLPP